ncbi:MAG: cytochrome b/b6 domain-containing protein [Pseudomonadota bacterium]
MTLSNTATRYGTVAKSLHWLTALLILTLIPTGIIANDMPYDTAEQLAEKARLFSIHKTMGVAVFFVALARILWALTQTKPAPLHPERRVETFAASTAHWLLYGSLILVPLSGWIHHASTEGFAPILWPFSQELPFVPNSDRLAEVTASLHLIFERVMVAALLAHIAGAFKHHLFDRDATLKRMWFGAAEGGLGKLHPKGAAPVGAAVATWGVALFIGSTMGLFEPHARTIVATAELEAVESEWQVVDGTLEIVVNQFGSDVAGTFADWTAAINFDETSSTGDVNVTVAIASLTLGSVTDNALGPEYFAAADFPTAEFQAEIAPAERGYIAAGTLTIKGVTVPIQLPFALDIDGDLASMEGRLSLDRTEFGVGGPAEDTVKRSVGVNVTLSASKGGAGS